MKWSKTYIFRYRKKKRGIPGDDDLCGIIEDAQGQEKRKDTNRNQARYRTDAI